MGGHTKILEKYCAWFECFTDFPPGQAILVKQILRGVEEILPSTMVMYFSSMPDSSSSGGT